jgi:hypothetical protein
MLMLAVAVVLSLDAPEAAKYLFLLLSKFEISSRLEY